MMSPDPRAEYQKVLLERVELSNRATTTRNPVCAQGPAPQTTETTDAHGDNRPTARANDRDVQQAISQDTMIHDSVSPESTETHDSGYGLPERISCAIKQLLAQKPHERLRRQWWSKHATEWHANIIENGFTPSLLRTAGHLSGPIQQSSTKSPKLREAVQEYVSEHKLEEVAISSPEVRSESAQHRKSRAAFG